MVTRRIGGVNAAGVVVVQNDGEFSVNPGTKGVGVFVGPMKKGDDTGRPIYVSSKELFIKKCGGLWPDSEMSDAVFDYFEQAGGVGQLYLLRVLDDTEVAASLDLYDRQAPRQNTFSVSAKSKGRWGGRRAFYVGAYGDTSFSSTNITTFTPTTPTWLLNQWKSGTLYLSTVPTKSYSIKSNTTLAAIVGAEDNLYADHAAAGAGTFLIAMENTSDNLAVQIVPSGVEDYAGEFGMVVYENGIPVLKYENLSLDPDAKNFVENVVNQDYGNEYITVDAQLGNYSAVAATKPANWYGKATGVSGQTLTLDPIQIESAENVTAGTYKIEVLRVGSKCVEHTVTLDFSGATGFTAIYSAPFHDPATTSKFVEVVGVVQDIADVDFSDKITAPDVYKEYTIDFAVVDLNSNKTDNPSAAFGATSAITFRVLPVPTDEAITFGAYGCQAFPDFDNDRRTSFLITDNTPNTVTIKGTADLTSYVTAEPAVPSVTTGDISLIDFDTKSFSVSVDNAAYQTAAVTGATVGAAALKVFLDANFTGITTTVVGNTLKIEGQTKGGYAKMALDGTGFEASGANVEGIYYGTNGDEVLLSYAQELKAGYEPGPSAYSDSDWTDLLDTDTSPIRTLMDKNLGLLTVACPGESATAINQAVLAFTEKWSYSGFPHIPSNITTEDAVETYVNDTMGRSDMGVVVFPSFAIVPNRFGSGFVTKTIVGKILGERARFAAAYGGYHRPASGAYAILRGIVQLPTEVSRATPLDEEKLTPQGINIIKKYKGNYIIWGGRTISVDPQWKFIGQREQMSYYTHVIRENFTEQVFEIPTKNRRTLIESALRKFFQDEYHNEVLVIDYGFDYAVELHIDSSVNTPESLAAGKLYAVVGVRVAQFIEQLIFGLTRGSAPRVAKAQ